ncbi:segregation/condensation protein A [Bacillota bacterium LX-D]|nr:segregation/condensation protein A [Bacillota bacterium LX-D]
MSYHISLEIFEGPLDLLLHLIQKQKLDIYDVPIAKITQQYLNYLDTMHNLDIEIASEFLVMAATLLSIKAKMLLPNPSTEKEDEISTEDPREELINRLLEYQQYKEAAVFLRERGLFFAQRYFRSLDHTLLEAVFSKINPLENVEVSDLLAAFNKVLIRPKKDFKPIKQIKRKSITISGQIKLILQLLNSNKNGLKFEEIFQTGASRSEIILTFLALLELIHLKKVIVEQQKNFSPLILYLA